MFCSSKSGLFLHGFGLRRACGHQCCWLVLSQVTAVVTQHSSVPPLLSPMQKCSSGQQTLTE